MECFNCIVYVFVLKGGLEILHFTKELIRDRNLQRPQGLNSGRLHKLDNPMQKFNIVDKIEINLFLHVWQFLNENSNFKNT